jgi:hypothetical protein
VALVRRPIIQRTVAAPRHAPPVKGGVLLPLLAVILLSLAAFQLVGWGYLYGAQALEKLLTARPLAVLTATPRVENPLGTQPSALTWPLPIRPQQVQFGNATSPLKLHIFTNPGCAECRRQTRRWLAALPAGTPVHMVYHIWGNEADANVATTALMLELARREGVLLPVWQALQTEDADLTPADWLQLLAAQNVPLATIQAFLQQQSSQLTNTTLDADQSLARTLGIQEAFALFLGQAGQGTFRLDTLGLRPDRLPLIIQRLQSGTPLRQPDDAWWLTTP